MDPSTQQSSRNFTDRVRDVISRELRRHRSTYTTLIAGALIILYFIYFGYAMFYSFGDEPSVRLLVVTLFSVVIAVIKLTGHVWLWPSVYFIGDALFSKNTRVKRRIVQWTMYIVSTIGVVLILVFEVAMETPGNLLSLAGLAAFIILCWVFSTNPGKTQAAQVIEPYLDDMTKSELHAVMTGGFATIAGSVLAAYIGFGVPANHLLSASVMSAPASLAVSKLLCPETEVTKAAEDTNYYNMSKTGGKNIVEAASQGASDAIALVGTILVNLIAFLALLAFVNATLSWCGDRVGVDLSFEMICSYVLFPVALFMGTDLVDCRRVAELVGIKSFTNEFIAYQSLTELLNNRGTWLNYTSLYNTTADWTKQDIDVHLTHWNITLSRGFLTRRSEVISTYALCGFSNFGSIGIYLGGLSVLAPVKKPVLVKIVLRCMIAGNVACFMTACIAGLFFKDFGE